MLNHQIPKRLWFNINGIPTFLYTHYCPLFHLTNLIVLLSPLILFFRVVLVVLRALYACLDLIPWGKIREFFVSFLPEKVEKENCKLRTHCGNGTQNLHTTSL